MTFFVRVSLSIDRASFFGQTSTILDVVQKALSKVSEHAALHLPALTKPERFVNLLATGLVACAIALIMTPASLHRRSAPHHVYEAFLYTSCRLLLCSMVPLALGISVDFILSPGS